MPLQSLLGTTALPCLTRLEGALVPHGTALDGLARLDALWAATVLDAPRLVHLQTLAYADTPWHMLHRFKCLRVLHLAPERAPCLHFDEILDVPGLLSAADQLRALSRLHLALSPLAHRHPHTGCVTLQQLRRLARYTAHVAELHVHYASFDLAAFSEGAAHEQSLPVLAAALPVHDAAPHDGAAADSDAGSNAASNGELPAADRTELPEPDVWHGGGPHPRVHAAAQPRACARPLTGAPALSNLRTLHADVHPACTAHDMPRVSAGAYGFADWLMRCRQLADVQLQVMLDCGAPTHSAVPVAAGGTLAVLASALQTLPRLASLDADGAAGSQEALPVYQLAQMGPQLRCLILRSGFGRGTQAVHLSRLTGLTRLELPSERWPVTQRGRHLTVAFSEQHLSKLLRPLRHLRHLEARSPPLGLHEGGTAAAVAALQGMRGLTRVCLSVVARVRGDVHNPGALHAVCAGLSQLHCLRHLDIMPVNLTVNGSVPWRAPRPPRRGVKKVQLLPVGGSWPDVGPDGTQSQVEAAAEQLRELKLLTWLSLSRCRRELFRHPW